MKRQWERERRLRNWNSSTNIGAEVVLGTVRTLTLQTGSLREEKEKEN
jgi:hypothetical protein